MYLALYRKYRPRTFDDVISQEHITTTLKNQIVLGQIAHAYLFTGTRGTGKTSCAKIMAKAVNCLSPVNGNPCGECEACRAVSSGSTDIIEIDAASNNGVDSIRQIRDEVIYTPIDCKYKVYIIDEVHMLTGAAFNALLKTLEEPPEHVIFILATTEYYKVPATILSRCQQFLFSKIDPEQSAKRLSEIAEKENVELTADGAALIARLSDGAMRDALSLLDQCLSSEGRVDEEAVRRCSGSADSGYLFAVSEAAIKREPSEAIEVLDRLINNGKDLSRFIEELTLHYRNLMLAKSVGTDLIKSSDGDLKRYKQQCGEYSLEEIMRHIDLISDSLDNINRMKQTGQARILAEQLLIRLTTPKLTNDASALAARLGALEDRLENVLKGNVVVKSESGFDRDRSVGADISYNPMPPRENKESDRFMPREKAKSEELPLKEKDEAEESTLVIGQDDQPMGDLPDEAPILADNAAEAVFDDDIPLPPPPAFEEALDISEAKTVNIQNKESAAKDAMPPNRETEKRQDDTAGRAIIETDFELPENTPPLPQWGDIISSLPSSSGRLLKKSAAYLYDGKIYINASTSAKTVLENKTKAAAIYEKTAEVLGGSFDIFILRERSVSETKKEDRITPFLDKARAMGIEVALKDR